VVLLITVIGAGRVGSSAALFLALKELDDILMIDIVENLPQGHALDMGHALSILGIDTKIMGSNDFSDMKGSDLVIITAGFPRKPGMTREELVAKNAGIIVDIARKVREYAPDSIVMLTTNPLDAMAYLIYKKLGFSRERVIGFSGVLDSGRLRYYASKMLDVSYTSIVPVVIGQHGQKMFPVPRLSTIAGKPLIDVMSREDIDKLVNDTVAAGATITKLRGFSSNFAPGAGLAVMAEAIKKDLKKVFLASIYLDGEYGLKDVTASVPVILGHMGAERVIELPLTENERKGFIESVNAIKTNISQIPKEFLE
jgi:malate dehydrogenase